MKTSKIFFSIITNLLLLCIGQSLQAQNMQLEVSSFVLEENALTAKNEPVYDNNNQKCALVIIRGMGEEKLRFSTGNSFIQVDEKKVDGERAYLMWLSEGLIKVTISSDSKSFEPIEYYFNPRVKKAETYLMNLKLKEIHSSLNKQYLQFEIEPKNATLEVNNELWVLSDGIAYKQLPRGKYQYQIKAKNYHPETGIIDFNDLNIKKTISIILKPNFGFLSLSAENGTSIFIDDEPYSGNLTNIQLSSGKHIIRAIKDKYLPFSQTISIEDNQHVPLAITLSPNFSTISIQTNDESLIYIDDNLMGQSNWRGTLGVGTYKLDLKKNNHYPYSEKIEIDKIGQNISLNYKPLKPITGILSVESTPAGAKIELDGKEIGITPQIFNNVIIGKHKLRLSKENYDVYFSEIEISENDETIITSKLEKETKIKIYIKSDPSSADIFVKDKYIGKTPYTLEVEKGEANSIKVQKNGYETQEKFFSASENRDLFFHLIRQKLGTSIVIDSKPSDALVIIDKKIVGRTPYMGNILFGKHKIIIQKQGYIDFVDTIYKLSDRPIKLKVSLSELK